MANLNRSGQAYEYVAMGSRGDYDVLQPAGASFLDQIRSKLSASWKGATPEERRHFGGLNTSLSRLSGFFLQAARMGQHAATLHERVWQVPANATAAATEAEACTDFESLLLHGRAALDSMTLAISNFGRGGVSDRFSKLRNVLRQQGDARSADALRHLDAALPVIGGLLVEDDESKGWYLRSVIAHRSSIESLARNAFTIHRLGERRAIVFDCEVSRGGSDNTVPILASAHRLTAPVPYLVLNCLARYLDLNEEFPIDGFSAKWTNPSIVFSAFLDASKSGPEISVMRMLPDGFSLRTEHLSPSVYDRVLTMD